MIQDITVPCPVKIEISVVGDIEDSLFISGAGIIDDDFIVIGPGIGNPGIHIPGIAFLHILAVIGKAHGRILCHLAAWWLYSFPDSVNFPFAILFAYLPTTAPK